MNCCCLLTKSGDGCVDCCVCCCNPSVLFPFMRSNLLIPFGRDAELLPPDPIEPVDFCLST